MAGNGIRLVILLTCSSVAFAQTAIPDQQRRVFIFAGAATPLETEEVAAVIRGVTGITSASVDAQAKTITIQGNASQVAMAEWIAGELESPPHRASPELRISADDLLRIFYLSPARTVLEQQEIATIIRAIGEIQTSFTCAYPRNALIFRGTPTQIQFAGRLFDELDQKGNAQPHTRHSISTEFRGPGGNDEEVRVVYLSEAKTIETFQEQSTIMRAIAMLRAYGYNTARALVLPGSSAQLDVAAWILDVLDRPPGVEGSGTYQYRPSPGQDELIQVFYLPNTGSAKRLQEVALWVGEATRILMRFPYTATSALIVRGTADQVALAGQLAKEQNHP